MSREYYVRGWKGEEGEKSSETIALGLVLSLTLLQHQVGADGPLPNIVNFLNDSLEVRCSVVGASDEDVVVLAVCCGSVQRRDGDESRRYSEVINILYLGQSTDEYTYLS